MKLIPRLGMAAKAALAAFSSTPPRNLNAVDNGGSWLTLFDSDRHINFQIDDCDDWSHGGHDRLVRFAPVYACLTLIASDIGKIGIRLMQRDSSGVWTPTENSAYSPFLRKPNHYQTWQQFIEFWSLSKLQRGNSYILKVRDASMKVRSGYVLDPTRVEPLVAPDGSVWYRLMRDDLSRLPNDVEAVPASEIFHDRMECLFHPLVGIPPLYAGAISAGQGLKIQRNSSTFFGNLSRPSGILSSPDRIGDETAKEYKARWEQNYGQGKQGSVAVLGSGLEYKPITQNAVDAQLYEQLKITGEFACSVFHVPAYKVGVGPLPAYNNIEALEIAYFSQCLQKLMQAIEVLLDDGLGLDPLQYRTEFDIDDLLRMDTTARVKAWNERVAGGWTAPDEARAAFNMLPVPGGASPMMQQQNYSLAALAKRDQQEDPFATAKPPAAAPAPAPAPADEPPNDDGTKALRAELEMHRFMAGVRKRAGELLHG